MKTRQQKAATLQAQSKRVDRAIFGKLKQEKRSLFVVHDDIDTETAAEAEQEAERMEQAADDMFPDIEMEYTELEADRLRVGSY